MTLHRSAIVVMTLACLLGACGTKGPLFVQGVPVGAPWPYPQRTPAPQPAERKPADVPAATDEKK